MDALAFLSRELTKINRLVIVANIGLHHHTNNGSQKRKVYSLRFLVKCSADMFCTLSFAFSTSSASKPAKTKTTRQHDPTLGQSCMASLVEAKD